MANPKPPTADMQRVPPSDRTEELVTYFVDRLSGRLGRTMLIKLIYLTDLEARRYLGRPMSGLTYRLWQQGPFDPALYKTLDRLRDSGEITEEMVPFSVGTGYRYRSARPGRTHELNPAEEALLTYVLGTYATKDLQQVLDVVYDSEPMRRIDGAELKTRVPVECVDNEMRLRLGGIDLESALAGEEDARRGNTIPWSTLRSELLDRD